MSTVLYYYLLHNNTMYNVQENPKKLPLDASMNTIFTAQVTVSMMQKRLTSIPLMTVSRLMQPTIRRVRGYHTKSGTHFQLMHRKYGIPSALRQKQSFCTLHQSQTLTHGHISIHQTSVFCCLVDLQHHKQSMSSNLHTSLHVFMTFMERYSTKSQQGTGC